MKILISTSTHPQFPTRATPPRRHPQAPQPWRPALRKFLHRALAAFIEFAHPSTARRSEAFSIVRVTGLVAVSLGMLSILNLWTRLDTTAVRFLLIPPDDALGLIFLGFALRLSRLEDFRPPIRLILRTSRICLIVLGVSKILGVLLAANHQPTLPASLSSPTGLTLGVLYLLLGIYLNIRHGQQGKRARALSRIAILTCLGSCWIALLLLFGGISSIPQQFQIHPVPLVMITAVSALLCLPQTRRYQQGHFAHLEPESALSRALFPLAYSIPIVLAFLRYHAESSKLVHPELALLLHVVLSAGTTIALISYSIARTQASRHQTETNDAVAASLDAQYRTVFSSLSLPVWIFCAEGRLTFANDAANKLIPPPVHPADLPATQPADRPFTAEQRRAIFNAALFGWPLASLLVPQPASPRPLELKVECLELIQTYRGTPGSIVLVASRTPEPPPDQENPS